MAIQTIGILGAGRVGIVLAQLALKAGYNVLLSASGSPAKIKLTTKILAPGAQAVTNQEATRQADLVLLALPLSKYKTIPKNDLVGKLIVDTMNHWPEVDGPRDEIIADSTSSSEAVQAFLDSSRVVKALSHMGYHELHDSPNKPGDPDRKAIAIAGDNEADKKIVSHFVDSIGFDPLDIGPLSHGKYLEPGHPAFGARENKTALAKLISAPSKNSAI